MFLDSKALFSDAQALTASAASTNIIDLGADGNLGIGEPMAAVVTLDVAADNTTGDETYTVSLQTEDIEAFTTAVTIGSNTIAAGSAAGSKVVIPVPADTNCDRYIRLYYTLGGTTPTATITAFLVPMSMIQNDVVYPDNITIS